MIWSDAPEQSGEESARNGDEASERYLKRRNMGQRPFADHDRKSCACARCCRVEVKYVGKRTRSRGRSA